LNDFDRDPAFRGLQPTQAHFLLSGIIFLQLGGVRPVIVSTDTDRAISGIGEPGFFAPARS
jgi:hypothetical protein